MYNFKNFTNEKRKTAGIQESFPLQQENFQVHEKIAGSCYIFCYSGNYCRHRYIDDVFIPLLS